MRSRRPRLFYTVKMQGDLEALELVCKRYDAFYSSDALRRKTNRARALQRRLTKLEAENPLLKGANRRWQQHVSSGVKVVKL